MATKFLRKIILEELHKVLEEQAIPGVAPGQTYTPLAGGVTGKSMKTPKPGDINFMGPEQPTDIPGSGSVISSSPKRIATLKIQQELAKLGFLDKEDIDGKPGPTTAEAFSAAMGATGEQAITGDEMKRFSLVDLRTMAPAIKAGNKQELQKLAMKYRVEKATAPALAAAGVGKDSVSPAGETASPSSGDEFIQNRMKGQQDLERKMNEPPTKIKVKKESIAREIRKLLRSI